MSSANSTAPLVEQEGGVIHGMWIPCVVFAHAFAAFFLVRMMVVMYPKAWSDFKRTLLCRKKLPKQPSQKVATKPPVITSGADTGATTDQSRTKGQTAANALMGSKDAMQRPQTRGSSVSSTPVSTHRTHTTYFDLEETGDEEAALPAEISGDVIRGVPSQQSRILMRRLTTLAAPMVMEWRDLGCAYNTNTGVRTVLKHVWGRADPGDMLALMGPSGAGKSTLMDILAGRKSVGNLTGEVLVAGLPREQDEFARKTAYVPQDDNFLPTMTVHETCSYYAALLLPRSWSGSQRRERIREVLAAMGLSHTNDTLVGGTLPGGIILRGLSGGERKRLSIATGIMSTPCIVFLDEPTSGLDSFAALSVMSYMRTMANGGQTVISSIHQPRAAIWALFDSVTLLSMGNLMYFGAREELVPWFSEDLGYTYEPNMHGLASDWVMDLVNIGFKKPEALFGKMMNTMEELELAAAAFKRRYLGGTGNGAAAAVGAAPLPAGAIATGGVNHAASHNSDAEYAALESAYGNGGSRTAGTQADAMHRVLDNVEQQQTAASAPAKKKKKGGLFGSNRRHSNASWFAQFRVLLGREFLSVTRNPADVAGRCLIFCWLAIFTGLIYYNLSPSVESLRARLNVLFVEPVILLLLPYVYMSLYTADKQYYIADSSAKLYHPSAYYVAKQVAVMPFAILNVLLFSYTLYGLAGLRHLGSSVGMNGLISVLLYLIAAQVLAFAAVITPNQDVAFMLAIAWTAVNLLMSNFMVRYQDMTQNWLSQLRYISAMGYGFEGYARAEFSGVEYSCAGGVAPDLVNYLPQFLPTLSTFQINAVNNAVTNPGEDCMVNLDQIINYFQLFRPFWTTVVILLGYLGFFHLLTYFGFIWLTKKERR